MRRLMTVACCLAVMSGCNRAPQSEQPASSEPAPDAAAAPPASAPAADSATRNPVQTEMALLHVATLTSVNAVVNNSLALVAPSFESVHAARQNTIAFLATGTYRLPRNPERAAEFEQRDEAFHQQLEGLVEAARANDPAGTARQLGVVLEACTACHAVFRSPVTPPAPGAAN